MTNVAITKVVPQPLLHTNAIRGESAMSEQKKYAAVYRFGNSVVNIVAPDPMTEEEKNKVLDDLHQAAWNIIYEWMDKQGEQREGHNL